MAEKDKKDDDKGRKDADNKVVDDDDDDDEDDDDDDDPDAANWDRLADVVDKAVEKRLTAWQSKQKTTSSPSRRKEAPKKPARKQGFLSGQFFSNLNPKNEEE